MATQQANMGEVLILDSDAARAKNFGRSLRYLNYTPIVAAQKTAINDIAEQPAIAVILGDASGESEFDQLATDYRAEHPSIPFICFPAAAERQRRLGDELSWSLDLPLRRSQLERLLQRAARYQGEERRQRLTGSSPPIRGVRKLIEQVSDFDTTVLITGQSGTGKELVARTVHELSARASGPFVPLNCGAIPPDLLESELFGHEKGAFTGAINKRVGRFELAEGGTLFLDEIGEMSLQMQVKMLRVLQERTFERVGSGKLKTCDVRIIAATHRDLPLAIEQRDFREDLFYRLNVFPIEMPPLFKRVSDLPLLLDELLLSQSADGSRTLRVSPEAVRVLANYRWPGNVRELSNLVERLAIMKPEGTIAVDDLPPKYREAPAGPVAEINHVTEAMQLTNASLKQHLQNVEQDLIGQAMRVSEGVVAQAARLLNMRRTTLVEKIGKYKIA